MALLAFCPGRRPARATLELTPYTAPDADHGALALTRAVAADAPPGLGLRRRHLPARHRRRSPPRSATTSASGSARSPSSGRASGCSTAAGEPLARPGRPASSPPPPAISERARGPAVSAAGRASHVAAIDQGTTSTRCLVFDHAGRMVVGRPARAPPVTSPGPGWAEHDAAEIWRNTLRVLPEALDQAGLEPGRPGRRRDRQPARDHGRVGPRDRAPGRAGHHLAGHPHHRLVERAQPRPVGGALPEVCGLRAGRLLRRTPAALAARPRARACSGAPRAGEVAFGTIESWLIWNLTGGPDGGVHVTDVTNASRTMLMDIRTLQWDQRLLDALDIPRELLPEIRPNAQVYGTCARRAARRTDRRRLRRPAGRAVRPDLLRRRRGQVHLRHRRVPADEHRRPDHRLRARPDLHRRLRPRRTSPRVYATEGSIAVAGALVQWFRDSLEMIRSAPEIETLARRVEDNGGCYIVPAFAGLFAPALAARRPRRRRRADVVRHPLAPGARGPRGDGVADRARSSRPWPPTPGSRSPPSRSTAA